MGERGSAVGRDSTLQSGRLYPPGKETEWVPEPVWALLGNRIPTIYQLSLHYVDWAISAYENENVETRRRYCNWRLSWKRPRFLEQAEAWQKVQVRSVSCHCSCCLDVGTPSHFCRAAVPARQSRNVRCNPADMEQVQPPEVSLRFKPVEMWKS